MNVDALSTARQCAQNLLDRVADDPDARVRAREAFYVFHQPAHPGSPAASELAFTRWEAKRGVLNSMAAGGSAWWRAVNARILFESEVGARLGDQPAQGATLGETAWQKWIKTKSPVDWYRAHNTSVASAYLDFVDLALCEPATERPFLNIVLYRVLFAQLLEEGKAAGRHPDLGELAAHLADPDLPSVAVLVSIDGFYPSDYPMNDDQLASARGESWRPEADLVRIFDQGVVLPEAQRAYRWAARTLHLPGLLELIQAGLPFYPEPSTLPPVLTGPALLAVRAAVVALGAAQWAPLRAL